MSDHLKDDQAYCWHPMTQHGLESNFPVITKAKGAVLYDDQGREILDMIASWWTCVHGHSHPALNQALKEQAENCEHVMFAGFTHPPAINLAKKLAELLPGDLNKVFYSDNGSTANEIALKIAYQYWRNKGEVQRTKFLAFDKAYHGETVGAMSVGKGSYFFKPFEDLLFSVDLLPYPETWDGDETTEEREKQALAMIEQKLAQEKDRLAALIVEPMMQGAGGVRLSRPSFMKAVTEMAQAHDILVIYDEVATGFGRTGAMFACEKIGVTPDMICLSKGLTSGYLPMAVTVATDRIYNQFLSQDVDKGFLHSHTFTGNPLACAVALQSLQLFEEEQTMNKVAQIERQHQAFLKNLAQKEAIYKPRVMGPVMAFNLYDGGRQYKDEACEWLRFWFLEHGFNIRPIGDAVYLLPPYCMTEEQLQRAYDAIEQGLAAFRKTQRLAA